jgi:hypothetical protein
MIEPTDGTLLTNSTSSLQFTHVFRIEEILGVLSLHMTPSSLIDLSFTSKRFLQLLENFTVPRICEEYDNYTKIVNECCLKMFGCDIPKDITFWCSNIYVILEKGEKREDEKEDEKKAKAALSNYLKIVHYLMFVRVMSKKIQESDSKARRALWAFIIDKNVVNFRLFIGSELIAGLIIASNLLSNDLRMICSKFPNLEVIFAIKGCTLDSNLDYSSYMKLKEFNIIYGTCVGGIQIQLPNLHCFYMICKQAKNAPNIEEENFIRFTFGYKLAHL